MKVQGDPNNPVPVKGLVAVPKGHKQLTLTSSAALLSSVSGGIPAGATFAVLRVSTANARWRDDGTAPTASIGMPMNTGDPPLVYDGDLTALQLIAATGSPVLDVAFYA